MTDAEYIDAGFEWAAGFTNLSGETRGKIKSAIERQFIDGTVRTAEREMASLIDDSFNWPAGEKWLADLQPPGRSHMKGLADLFVHFAIMKAYALRDFDQHMTCTDTRPYWMLDAIDDELTYPDCRRRNNTIKRWDDKFWSDNPIPCGRAYCRCSIITLTAEKAASLSKVAK